MDWHQVSRLNTPGRFTSMTTTAAIYLRISLDDDNDGLAIARQRQDCEAIIATRGWTLADVYVDQSITASKRTVRRPAYDRMEADYRAGRFDAIVCYDLDRLTRQPRQLEDWIDAAEQGQLRLVTVSGEADLSTDNGRLFARMKAAVARSEIERKGARQRRANEQRVQMGLPVKGVRLYGYEKDGITPVPDEAAAVRRMFDHIDAGGTLYSLCAWLNENVPNNAPAPWAPQRVRTLLHNRRYCGEVRRYGEWLPSDRVQPIIDPEQAARVRLILDDPARRTKPGPHAVYLLSSIAQCGVCHENVKMLSSGTRRPGAGYYCCTAVRSHLTVNIERMNALAIRRVAEVIAEDSSRLMQAAHDDTSTPIRTLTSRLADNERSAMATSRDRDEGLLSESVARARLLELRDARLVLEKQLSDVRLEHSSAGRLLAAASSLLDLTREPVAEGIRVAELIEQRLIALPVEQQCEVIRAVAYVEILPYRSAAGRPRGYEERLNVASRYEIEHSDVA